jgi:hypothetical protein
LIKLTLNAADEDQRTSSALRLSASYLVFIQRGIASFDRRAGDARDRQREKKRRLSPLPFPMSGIGTATTSAG